MDDHKKSKELEELMGRFREMGMPSGPPTHIPSPFATLERQGSKKNRKTNRKGNG